MQRALLSVGLLILVVVPSAARAEGEPIMPLSEVRQGMACQAASVVRGTAISTFDIEILDVVRGDTSAQAPRILFRASGPAVDATGIGPGFSGSPIRCPDGAGTMRNIGAISEGIGEYGGKVGLATPIELVLGEPVEPPRSARRDGAMLRRAQPFASPLTVAGVGTSMAGVLRRAAAKAGRPLLVVPSSTPRSFFDFAVQPLVPGAAVSIGYTSGALNIGAVGTVAYTDGDRVWAFGHPLDGVGRRALLLQDAYVYAVINNPNSSAEQSTYKLAAGGHDVGILSNDANSAVVGRVGPRPPSFPLKVVATDLDTKVVRSQQTLVTDETDLDLPAGGSALGLAATTAIGNAAYVTISGAPVRQSGSLCLRVAIVERKKPLRFCNTYVGGGPGPNAAVLGDVSSAVSLLDTYEFGRLHVTSVEANLRLRRSFPQAYIVKATAPRSVRRGGRLRVRLTLRHSRGASFTRTITVRVPRGMPVGARRLTLDGTSPDSGGSAEDALATVIDLGDGGDGESDSSEPRTVTQLAKAFAGLHRYDGITTSFQPYGQAPSREDEIAALLGEDGSSQLPSGPEGVAQKPRKTYRDPELRIGGSARVRVVVRP